MAKKILIVDDEADILKVSEFRLKSAGYEVFARPNGEEALKVIKSSSLDLILLDLRLPDISGLEICKIIKAAPDLKHIPVIVFTASAQDLDKKARQVGAEGYMLKPFDSGELLEKVRKMIG